MESSELRFRHVGLSSDGTVIFSLDLERLLSGGTKLTWGH